jgi:hypothetical protein
VYLRGDAPDHRRVERKEEGFSWKLPMSPDPTPLASHHYNKVNRLAGLAYVPLSAHS